MVDIIPAVLPKTFRELQEQLERLQGISPLVQIDIIEAGFLHNQDAMPYWELFDFEFDVMVPHPEREISALIALGATRIVVHADSPGVQHAMQMLQETRAGDWGIEVGIALRAHDTIDTLKSFEGLFDYVQVMGIDHEGRQGEPPDPHGRELELLRALRAASPKLLLQVDGAASAHPKELVVAGAARLIVGAAIVHSKDPQAAYKTVYTEANAK